MDQIDELHKVDVLRERAGITYRKARDVLERAGWDVVEALALLEDEEADDDEGEKWAERVMEKGGEMFGKFKGFIAKNAGTKVRLKKGSRVLAEIPAGAGVVGFVGMLMSSRLAVLGALGTVAALFNECSLEIERPKTDVNPEAV